MKALKRRRKKSKKKRKTKSQKIVLTTFEKRKCKYDITYHYIEDVEYPSKTQRLFMVVCNPFWYNWILAITFVDVMLYMHAPIVSTERLITSNRKYQLLFELFVCIFKAADIFLAICVDYIMKLEFHNEARRPIWVLVCEIFGAIPFYPPVPLVIIKLGHFIKIIRLLYHTYAMRVSLRCHVPQRVVNFVLSLMICETIYAWIYFHISGLKPSWETYKQLFEVASASIVGKGGVVSRKHEYKDNILLHEVPMAVGVILVLFIFLKPTLCDIICLLTMQYESKFKYIYKVHFFESAIVPKYKCNQAVVTSILQYLRSFWEERQGVVHTPEMALSVKRVFPRALIMEMSLDASYDVFRHSQILKVMDIPVMRNLSIKIKNTLFMKGEYVYKKRSIVDCLIYVRTGAIDILSIENGDAGIISLTEGTVLGETSLFYPFKSKVNIRCKTVCHIFVLTRRDFTFIIRNYPSTYQDMLKLILSRVNIAKRVQRAKHAQTNPRIMEEQLVWLKAMLHNYKAEDPALKEFHLSKNIYLGPFLTTLVKKQDPLCHTLRYLDMLSIKRRIDAAYDLVFIRSKCIWILNYNSPIYNVWHAFIAILAVAMLILQPYVVFNESSVVLNVIIHAITLVFAVDLLLSLITPAHCKSKAVTLNEIFGERFKSVGFYLDVCTIINFNLFGHVFPFAHEKWMFIFHTVKLWKVYRLMNRWENRFKLNLLLQKYCVFIFSQFIYIYTLGYILKLDEVVPEPWDPVGIQIATGVGFQIKSKLMKTTILYAFVNTFSSVYECLGIVTVTAANYMQYIRSSRIYRSLQRLYRLSKYQPDSQLFKRLNSFLNTQINDNSAFTCAFDIHRFFNFPNHYRELLKSNIYANALMDLEFFQFVPKEVVKRVSSTAFTHIYHQHSLIVSYGTRYDVIYIIVQGQAMTLYGDKYFKTKVNAPINLLEVLYNMPCASNIVAMTEVEVVQFDFKRYVQLLARYKNQIDAMRDAKEVMRHEIVKHLDTCINGKQVVIRSLKRDQQESFVTFNIKNIYEDSYEEYDYFAPFDESSWGFTKYLLLRTTILPNGLFTFWWEITRCIFAYITCLVFFIPPISLQEIHHPYTYVLICLDLTAFADIFVRLHICYYNSKGLLITHPLHTAINYLKKAFIVDLLAAFPFYLLVHDSPQYKMILNIFHLFQIYRLIGFKLHYFYTSTLFDYLFIILTIICPVNFITCTIFVLDCYDWTNEENIEILCKNFKKESPLGNYITVSYFIMSTLTCSGTGNVVDLENVSPMILHIISACSFVSTFVRIYVTAYLFGSYNKIYIGSHKFRDKIRRLVTFLRMNNVRPYLRKQIKIYYELKWRWLHRINPFMIFKNLNPALRRDLIYCLHGEHMQLNCMIESVSNLLTMFFKNILFDAKPLIIPKNGYILTINDVQSSIYFISKGSVDVVAANGSVIETIYNGSFIGNLDNVQYTRQKVSFVTNTVTKLMFIDGRKFHRILDQFPTIKKSYNEIKNRTFYYIPSMYEENSYEKARWTWTKKELKAGFKKYRNYMILSHIHFVFPCCIGLTMELYQIATGEMHYSYLLIQYVFDLIHLVHQYLKFVTPYMSQEQEFVMHPLRIQAHSMGKKRLYWKLYFLNLPFDIPVLIILLSLKVDFGSWSLLFSLFRLNRLTRYVNISYIYYSGMKKVASFSRLFKIFLLFLLLIYSTQIVATIIAFSDFTYTYFLARNESQIIRDMPVRHLVNIRRGKAKYRAVLYGRYWFFSLCLHTFSHDNLYYPKGDFFELLFIVIFLYVTVFESLVMVQYYQILMESATLVKIVYAIKSYVDDYYNIPESAYVLREKVDEAIYHYYAVRSIADDCLMLTDCPVYLREAALMGIYGYLFQNHPYFENCHPDFLRQVIQKTRCMVYPINCTIASRMDCHDTLYFVHKGEVAAMKYECDFTGNALHLYCKGDSFGYQQAFQNKPYQYTYRTITFCEVLELSWSECSYLMDYFPMTKTYIKNIMKTEVKHFIKPLRGDSHRKRIRV